MYPATKAIVPMLAKPPPRSISQNTSANVPVSAISVPKTIPSNPQNMGVLPVGR